jgi:hypothetical protein
MNDFETKLDKELEYIRDVLLSKNDAYCNSVFDPVHIFSKVSAIEQLNVRIDDKLSRLSGCADEDEDVVLDLIGYLLLTRILTIYYY